MRRRWLAFCLLSYPRGTRERDGAYLLDLSLELGEDASVLRQGLSLVRGGVVERLRRLSGRGALLGGAVAALLAVGGVAAADSGSVRVEVHSCSEPNCGDVRSWAEDLERDGWTCERSATARDVSWQCVEP